MQNPISKSCIYMSLFSWHFPSDALGHLLSCGACLMDCLTHFFYIFVSPSWRWWWGLKFKILNRWFASFLKPELHEEFTCCIRMDYSKYFYLAVSVRGSFWIVKQDLIKIICFLRFPTSLVFGDRKMQSKQAHLHGNISGTKFSALCTGTRTTLILN
jgi:hypothetical protein